MKQMFYTQSARERQQRVLRKKRELLCGVTVTWALLSAVVFLLLTRENQFICTLTSGMISGIYFCWLLYFITYDYKKERDYASLIQESMSGRIKTVTGVVKAVEAEETPLGKEYRICFSQEDLEKDVRTYWLSGRENVEAQQWEGAALTLYVYQDRVAGFEVAV